MMIAKGEFKVTAFGNFQGITDSLRTVGETLCHFHRRFKVKLIGGKTKSFRVVYGFTGLDGEQDLVGIGFFPAKVMTVIGCHQLDAKFFAKFHQPVIGNGLLGNTVFLDFKVKTVTENFLQLNGLFPGPILVIMGNTPGDFAVQAGGQG